MATQTNARLLFALLMALSSVVGDGPNSSKSPHESLRLAADQGDAPAQTDLGFSEWRMLGTTRRRNRRIQQLGKQGRMQQQSG